MLPTYNFVDLPLYMTSIPEIQLDTDPRLYGLALNERIAKNAQL